MTTNVDVAEAAGWPMAGWQTVQRLAHSRFVILAVRAILVGFGVMLANFALIRFIPGDPAAQLVSSSDANSRELYEKYREQLGLNRPVHEQFFDYMGQVLQGNLGTSLLTKRSVNDSVAEALPMTLRLMGVTLLLGIGLSVPLGVLAAVYRRTWFGDVFWVGTSVVLATPGFYLGLLLLFLFALRLQWAPIAGYTPGFPDNIRSLWLPALTMCGGLVPNLSRVLQASISDTLDQEFVETAIVRGISRFNYVWRYLLRPSLGPTVALLGFISGRLLGGTVIVELVFNLPGMGSLLIKEGLGYRDYPVVQGVVLLFGLAVVVINFLADMLNEWLDPRTKTE